MLAVEAFGEVCVARLERIDDLLVLFDRAFGTMFLPQRHVADRPHMDEEIPDHLGDQRALAQLDDGLMEGDVGLGIFVHVFFGRLAFELVEDVAQGAQFLAGGALSGKARRHAFERGPHGDHLDDFRFGLADDEDAAARHSANEPLQLEDGQGLPDRRTADTQVFRQLALVEADLVGVAVDVHLGDRLLDGIIREVAQAGIDLEGGDVEPHVGLPGLTGPWPSRGTSAKLFTNRHDRLTLEEEGSLPRSRCGCFSPRLLASAHCAG
jgi:hypothetical protein